VDFFFAGIAARYPSNPGSDKRLYGKCLSVWSTSTTFTFTFVKPLTPFDSVVRSERKFLAGETQGERCIKERPGDTYRILAQGKN
jgi:hypothetical protein